jgi:4-hydroxy-2-oxoglutarate aldolase
MPLKLEGVFPPVPTPYDANGEIAPDKLKANIALWNKTGLRGYVVLGSNGEAVMLSEGEKLALWQAARDAIPRDKLFLVGAGMESTRASIALFSPRRAVPNA